MLDGSKSVSSYTMARHLSLTQKTASMLMHKIRGSFINRNDAELSGVVEVDGVWVSSKRKNKQVKQRHALRGTMADKYMVVERLNAAVRPL